MCLIFAKSTKSLLPLGNLKLCCYFISLSVMCTLYSKQISCMDFKTSQYLTVHSKAIRDCCFHPFVDDGILLSCGLDKTAKMTSVISNTVVQT